MYIFSTHRWAQKGGYTTFPRISWRGKYSPKKMEVGWTQASSLKILGGSYRNCNSHMFNGILDIRCDETEISKDIQILDIKI